LPLLVIVTFFIYTLKSKRISYQKGGELFQIANHALHHGHKGISGAKGSPTSFRNTNKKSVVGHSHVPIILDGFNSVGASCMLWQYYNEKGMGRQAHADIVLYPNNKSQLLVYTEDYKISNFL